MGRMKKGGREDQRKSDGGVADALKTVTHFRVKLRICSYNAQ